MPFLTKGLKILQEKLFYLFIFLLPTQLAFHYWPEWAYIFGVRVDYLSPTIYITDLLFVVLLVLSLPRLFILRKSKRSVVILTIFLLLFSVVNIAIASVWQVALLRWIKIFELLLVTIYVAKAEFITKKMLLKALALSVIFVSAIGIFQFVIQKSVGGPLYFIGEREFYSLTPGIAKIVLYGRNFVRAYSVFSHPNSFAGYLLVSLLMLLYLGASGKKYFAAILFSLIGLILTFSKTAMAGVLVVSGLGWVLRKGLVSINKLSNTIMLSALLVSLSFLALSFFDWTAYTVNTSFLERLMLTTAAGKMIFTSPLFGVGLNNFVIMLSGVETHNTFLWVFQPVHNIFLLSLVEVGLIGFSFLFIIASKLLMKSFAHKNKFLALSFVAILFTGLFDHYWWTLQQNQLLLALVLGLSIRKNFSK